MKLLRTFALLAVTLVIQHASAQAPKTIYAYAIGDWRNGPVVAISPLFETTEAATDLMLIARARKDYPEFKDISDIIVQRFVTTEEGNLSRTTLKGKYEVRKLQVLMVEEPAKSAPAAPETAPKH